MCFFPTERDFFFFPSCLNCKVMLCYREFHTLSSLQHVGFGRFSVHVGQPPLTFALVTTLWYLRCCHLPASLYLKQEIVVTEYLFWQTILVKYPFPPPKSLWKLFRYFSFPRTVLKPLFLHCHVSQRPGIQHDNICKNNCLCSLL